jgi:hypothetical protein
MKLPEIFGFKSPVPETKMVTGKICFIGDLTLTGGDLNSQIHNGFTIGKGKKIYWEMIWHSSGHVTVFSLTNKHGRWIDGDSEITVHFK